MRVHMRAAGSHGFSRRLKNSSGVPFRGLWALQIEESHTHGAGDSRHAAVVARERDRLAVIA